MTVSTKKRTSAGVHCGAAAVVLLAVGCAHRPPRPLYPFTKSIHFDTSIYAILEEDINSDGLPDAVIARETETGWMVVSFLRHRDEKKGDVWEEIGEGGAVTGSELERLEWVSVPGGLLVLIVAVDDSPDELVQSFAIVDPLADCETRFADRILLPKPPQQVVAPGSVPAGVVVKEGMVQITDQPKGLMLAGAEGEVQLLREVRVRRLSGSRWQLVEQQGRVQFLQPITVTATLDQSADPQPPLPSLTDGEESTQLALRPDEMGRIVLQSDATIVALELHHGCWGANATLQLSIDDEPPFVTGEPLPADSFVLGARRSKKHPGNIKHDLVVLKEPVAEVAFTLGPPDSERCLREVKAYGFASNSSK